MGWAGARGGVLLTLKTSNSASFLVYLSWMILRPPVVFLQRGKERGEGGIVKGNQGGQGRGGG